MPNIAQRIKRAERLRIELETKDYQEEVHMRTIARVRESNFQSIMKLPVEEILNKATSEEANQGQERQWKLLNLARDKVLLNNRTKEMNISEKQQLASITQSICKIDLDKLKKTSKERQTSEIEGLLRRIWFILHQSNTDEMRDVKAIRILEDYQEILIERHLELNQNKYKTVQLIDRRERLAQLRRELLKVTQTYKELEEIAKIETEAVSKRKYLILAIDALMATNSQEKIENEKILNKDAQRIWSEYALQEIIITTAFNTASEPYSKEKESLFKKIYDNPKCITNRSYTEKY